MVIEKERFSRNFSIRIIVFIVTILCVLITLLFYFSFLEKFSAIKVDSVLKNILPLLNTSIITCFFPTTGIFLIWSAFYFFKISQEGLLIERIGLITWEEIIKSFINFLKKELLVLKE